jgi:hypothetical protein
LPSLRNAPQVTGNLFGERFVSSTSVAELLNAKHYLGAARRGFAWHDDFGAMVFANPSSRRLPHKTWLELIRWCITGGPNAGSQQWAAFSRYALAKLPHVTTVVSYSDPSQGHTGALYRACNWLWAPTWHRLRPPPTGNGEWVDGTIQSVKDRWIYPLRPDPERETILAVDDSGLRKRYPWASYTEPRWRGARRTGGGGDYHRWQKHFNASP